MASLTAIVGAWVAVVTGERTRARLTRTFYAAVSNGAGICVGAKEHIIDILTPLRDVTTVVGAGVSITAVDHPLSDTGAG